MDNYDFDRIGRQMPYRVPDSFFNNFEKDILSRASAAARRRRLLKSTCTAFGAAASVALLVIAAGFSSASRQSAPAGAELAQAFDRLSDTDRDCLLEIYQDDIFINQL